MAGELKRLRRILLRYDDTGVGGGVSRSGASYFLLAQKVTKDAPKGTPLWDPRRDACGRVQACSARYLRYRVHPLRCRSHVSRRSFSPPSDTRLCGYFLKAVNFYTTEAHGGTAHNCPTSTASAPAVGGAGGIVTIAPNRAAHTRGRAQAGSWGGSPERRFAYFAAEGKVGRRRSDETSPYSTPR